MPAIASLRRSESILGNSRPFDFVNGFTMPKLVSRSDDMSDNDGNDNIINILLVVLGVAFFALILVSLAFLFRRARRMRQHQRVESTLPTYKESKHTSNHHGLTIETTHNGRSSVFIIGRDGQPMLQNPSSPPHSPDNVPEIHITFPDEQDEQGRRKSGRVVVVRVGESAAVGLEPLREDEQLPAYEKEAKGQFYSIDMNQIGGLKEKDRSVFEH